MFKHGVSAYLTLIEDIYLALWFFHKLAYMAKKPYIYKFKMI